MLAAEDSTVVPEKHQDYGRIPPQRTKLYLPVVNIRQNNSRKSAAVHGIHGHTILWHFRKLCACDRLLSAQSSLLG